MAEKKPKKIPELKQFRLKEETKTQPERDTDFTTQVIALLQSFTSLIRTSKNIELQGNAHVRFNNLAADPAKCTIGEITVVGAKLKICTATDTWTIVGTQT